MRRKLTVMAMALALLAGACGDDDKKTADDGATTEGAVKVTVKTTEYSFEVPEEFGGGLVEIVLDNSDGKESHEAALTRLEGGKTLADLEAAADGPPPDYVKEAGGPGPVLPGESATYTGNLPAGTYVLRCNVPAPDGQDHAEKGMVAEVQVTEGEEGDLPDADVTIAGVETEAGGATAFSWQGQDDLKAGSQTVRFENTGKQQHHLAIIAAAPGKKLPDVMAFFANEGAPTGPPPFTGFPGLIGGLEPGDAAVRTLDLEAGGTYVLACFIPDTDGTPHAAKGMAAEVTV